MVTGRSLLGGIHWQGSPRHKPLSNKSRHAAGVFLCPDSMGRGGPRFAGRRGVNAR
ncbi:protein of unknown function [Microbacterium sp. Nx66]|nr:protein of unknown function [Microbacterium sp. Nx66]